MMKTAIDTIEPQVRVTPAPNGRALVQLEGRMFTLIDEVLTNEEIGLLMTALTSYALSHAPVGSEFAGGN